MSRSIEDMALGITQGFFGESVTFAQSGVDRNIKAVFENQFVESNGVSTYQLTARVLLADLASAPAKGNTITRNARTYKVSVAQLDSFGGAVLVLNE